MADIPNFEEFKKSLPSDGGIPSFEDFKAQQAAPATPPAQQGILSKAGDVAKRIVGTAASDLNPMNVIRGIPATYHQAFGKPDMGPTQDAIKSGNYGEAFKRGIGTLPVVGPPAEMLARGLTEGKDIPELIGHGAAMYLGGKAPGIVGKGLRSAAEPLAESALGIKAINRAYDRTPGAAALDETRGVRPGRVAESAQNRLRGINTELENVVGSSNAPIDLTPSRDVLGKAEGTARLRNAKKTVGQIAPMQEHLGTNMNTGLPLPAVQTPSEVLALKRGFGDEFIHNWNPETMKGVKGTAAQTYHKLADTLHQGVPESAALDTRASSLIPVAERAESIERGPGIGQRSIHRIAAHTGAGLGAFAGYTMGGLPGALAGGLIPEILADPTTQMIGARTMNTGAKILRNPITGKVGRAAPLFSIAGDRQ